MNWMRIAMYLLLTVGIGFVVYGVAFYWLLRKAKEREL